MSVCSRSRRSRSVRCVGVSLLHGITLADVGTTLLLGLATLIRVVVLIAIASVIWVPIGVWVGTQPARRQHGAAGGAVSGRVSGEPAVPDRGLGDRRAAGSIRISG